MTDGFHQIWLTLSRLISNYIWRQMCFAEILLLYHLVIAQIHIDPLQGDLHPSNYHERKRRWGDAAHPGFYFHFLKLYTTHHIVHFTGASHYERPVDSRIEADVFEGLSSMVGGLRQRRNFVTTVILVMLALRPKQVKYERSQELQGRHIQQVPPPTNIWRSAESWNISFSQRRRRLTDPLIKALMCGGISGRSVEERRSNFKINLLLPLLFSHMHRTDKSRVKANNFFLKNWKAFCVGRLL